MIVALEGIDGAGKSEQCMRLANVLHAVTMPCPTNDRLTYRLIRGHLACYWSAQPAVGSEGVSLGEDEVALLNAQVFQALMIANRASMVGAIATQALQQHVVLDRYWPSGYAYGSAGGMDGSMLISVSACLPQPDIFLLLDLPVEVALERLRQSGRQLDRNETAQVGAFLERVAMHYRHLWATARSLTGPGAFARTRRWEVIDGSRSPDEVAGAVTTAVMGAVA